MEPPRGTEMDREQTKKMRNYTKALILFPFGIVFSIPAVVSAFLELPWRGWWDTNETFFVLIAMLSPVFFFASFYFLRINFWRNLIMQVLAIWGTFLSISDINLYYANQMGFEMREPSYSLGAIVCFIMLTWCFVWRIRNEP